ncbi:(Na+)-NQR maturation NqrM [Bermanella sp. R86510]|uniref:(Na+)-NQR maturation NqrM n=1 Tax=unclassified Bermanella TaxID=2627862 RepID=UPI0037C86072
MEMMIVAFIFMLIIVALMSIGVLLQNKPITGSCGGMSAIGMETACDVCGGDKSKCDTEIEKAQNSNKADLAYDATENK